MGDLAKDILVLKDRLDKVEEKDIDGITLQMLNEMLQVVGEIAERLETLETQIEVLSEK